MKTIRKIRFFTIADFKEEENFFRNMHKQGFRFVSCRIPCFYYFEECTPEDVIYQLDFDNSKGKDKEAYVQLFQDCGWEYLTDVMGWYYFRKMAKDCTNEESIFSDTTSKLEMIDRILKRRMLPLVVFFTLWLLPQFTRLIGRMKHLDAIDFTIFICFILYVYVFIHAGYKLHQLKKQSL